VGLWVFHRVRFITRSVSLGFFSGSGGFSYFVEVSNMLVRGFLVGFLGFLCGLAEFASVYTSCVLRSALRFF
jgi:hypothetical protein